MIRTLFFSVLFLMMSGKSSSQNIFGVQGALGLNFAELEGDGQMDYFGLNAGLVGTARLSKNWQFSGEILFSQNGEYILPDTWPQVNYGKMRLNHIELPFHFDLKIPILKNSINHTLQLSWGMAYAYIFSHKAESLPDKQDQSDLIVYSKRTNILYQTGLSYQFSERWQLGSRISYAPSPGFTLYPTILFRTTFTIVA